MVSAHMERYDDVLPEAVAELADLAATAGVQLQVSHVKIQGDRRDELRARFLELVGRHRFHFDVTPYTSLCTRSRSLLARVRSDARAVDGLSSVRSLAGYWTVKPQAGQWRRTEMEQLERRLADDPGALVVADGLREADVDALLGHPGCFVATDAAAFPSHRATAAHPRAFSAFPCAIDRRLRAGAPLTEIAEQLSQRPGRWFGLADRGRIAAGWFADLVVLTPASPPRVRDVVVNGVVAVENGQVVALTAGRPLRRSAVGRVS